MHARLSTLFALVLLNACSGSDPSERCLVNDDCEATQRCVNGGCVPRDLRDGSTADDAPTSDAPGLDAEICGMPCDTGNACSMGAFDCASGNPICVGTGPADNGTVCRESLGECDPAETCDGASTECPPDMRSAAGESCRDSIGECDIAETCDGTSPACPFDAFEPAATPCVSVDGVCDGSGSCTSGCVTGAPCQPADPCRTGTLNCGTEPATCVVAGDAADGTSCGPTLMGAFGVCGGYDGECDESGTQSQEVFYSECDAGACRSVNRPVERICSRRREGVACTPRMSNSCARCELGTCRDFISCAPGFTCCGLSCSSTPCARE